MRGEDQQGVMKRNLPMDAEASGDTAPAADSQAPAWESVVPNQETRAALAESQVIDKLERFERVEDFYADMDI